MTNNYKRATIDKHSKPQSGSYKRDYSHGYSFVFDGKFRGIVDDENTKKKKQ